MDLEAPAARSPQHIVRVSQEVDADESTKIHLPIHFRYHPPSLSDTHYIVHISPPVVGFGCSFESQPITPARIMGHTADLYLSAQVPIGALKHDSVVMSSTLLVTVSSAMILIAVIVRIPNVFQGGTRCSNSKTKES